MVITGREIYDQVILVRSTLEGLSRSMLDIATRQTDHEQRLRLLERARWPLPSLALLVAAASFLVPFVVK